MTTSTTIHILKETLIDELQLLPELLRKAEVRYYDALHALADKREQLADAENARPSGEAPFKETAARLSAYRAFTGPLQAEVREAQAKADRLKAEVDFLQRRNENYRIMATLLTSD